MRLSKVFDRIAVGLRPTERQVLSRWAVEQEKNEAVFRQMLSQGSTTPRFKRIVAESGEFEVLPLDYVFVEVVNDQAVADSTFHQVAWDGYTGNSATFEINFNDNYIYVRPKHHVAFGGTMQWETNGTGRRAAHLDFYDIAGVQLFGITLVNINASGLSNDTIPFFVTTNLSLSFIHRIRMTVFQSSGGSLNLQNVYLGMFLVK